MVQQCNKCKQVVQKSLLKDEPVGDQQSVVISISRLYHLVTILQNFIDHKLKLVKLFL